MNAPSMHIGLAGPFRFEAFRGFFDPRVPLPAGLGGVPVIQLTQEYLHRGHQVTVFTLDPETKEPRWIEGDKLRVFVGPYRLQGRARDLFAQERAALENAIRESDVPFVHAHWTYEFALAALASGRPALITAHDAPLRILSLDPSPYRALRTVMTAQVLHRARHLTAVSPYVARHLRLMGYRRAVEIVPNGMLMPENGAIQSQHPNHLCRRSFTAILNGGWQGHKNGRRLLQAFAIVHRALPNATLTVYGAGLGEGEDAQAWAVDQGVAKGVYWKGYRTHAEVMHALANYTDVLVHPALEESFGLTILEAMAFGLPVVAGHRSGAVSWLTNDGRGALLVDMTSVKAIAGGMLRIINEPELARALARNGETHAREHFALSRVGDQYERLYQRLT